MKKMLFLPLLLLAAFLCTAPACSQTGAKPVYMQIFFEGPNWIAGREVLHYVPAYRGKTGELVAEGADTQAISPIRFLQGPHQTTQSSMTTTVTTDGGAFMTDSNGKAHRQTDEDIRKESQAERESIDKGLQLLEKRSRLAQEALTRALNYAAADGWEVVQMTAYGAPGGLVYLLHKR